LRDKPPDRSPRQVNQYLKYSGMAMQLFALVAVAAWLGTYLDRRLETSKPYITIILILLFTGVFFYRLIKDLNKSDEP
jgi:F0F1-type ATP synthase assembly protein I